MSPPVQRGGNFKNKPNTMLYVIYGDDRARILKKVHELKEKLLIKKPEASVFQPDSFEWNPALLESLTGGQGLFERKYIVVLGDFLEKKEIRGEMQNMFPRMKDSENIFILFDGLLDKKTEKELEKYANRTLRYEKVKKAVRAPFNIFSLSDFFVHRDSRELWTCFHVAKRIASIEEIHGILFWQLKTMWLAKDAETPEEVGLKPFVFRKARMGLKKFTAQEIEEKTYTLLEMYHEARRGRADLAIRLERFILSL